jgi:hypothetical protein
MDTAMTLNWLEMRRTSNARSRQDDQLRILTEIWIRLYEAALERSQGVVTALPAQPSNLLN